MWSLCPILMCWLYQIKCIEVTIVMSTCHSIQTPHRIYIDKVILFDLISRTVSLMELLSRLQPNICLSDATYRTYLEDLMRELMASFMYLFTFMVIDNCKAWYYPLPFPFTYFSLLPRRWATDYG